ncbi:MAG: polyprenyl diphosphate synthase [Spirochaetia bacterium]|jgi:undecaprenyl diphosphate synthase|uniref:Ditrans,polycis-undecaprenyl-diphosphate synthase ((2E,6E)-farnesyl-diphosphate specific) n=1 Tax=bioreactor metagenome TaxID=1076179 RepID=A0A644THQ8_9ZZZZ|nr:polyprenyl diphosphate synthase [Spirochaetia bacterium]MCE1209076.1 polyprenyl diphosphate synthase [Spirochaetia bacterium]HAP54888.1 di-trans,poly-cis-decaprenylcistransferase [Spirochaetaceae bacterium]HOI21923.1 polyprenyl diphosphate synthase [Spirochaetales bacterium]
MATPYPPLHIGIIMDGNGRWATKRGLPRTEGHRQGLEAAKRIVAACSDRGVSYLSLYTFSTENWKRTTEEVGFLMGLIKTHLAAELDFYRRNRIKLIHSGNRSGLPADILREIDKTVSDTSAFPGMVVNLAINYGGRDELLRAIGRLGSAKEAARGSLTEKDIASVLDHPEMPDPDLIIRTGGETRLSNFLLWQSAYSELYFTDRLWPDFDEEALDKALADFRSRDRRFGGL